jgi:hypothetical protein
MDGQLLRRLCHVLCRAPPSDVLLIATPYKEAPLLARASLGKESVKSATTVSPKTSHVNEQFSTEPPLPEHEFTAPKFPWSIGKVAVTASSDGDGTGDGDDGGPVPAKRGFIRLPWPIQAKLEVGAVDDPLEREADRVAEQVMRMPEPGADVRPAVSSAISGVQLKCSCGGSCDKCEGAKDQEQGRGSVQMKPLTTGASGHALTGFIAPPATHNVLAAPGQPLDVATQSFMEARFGVDFAHVRIHTGSDAAESAKAMGARAYTVGRHVVFADGEYKPASKRGRMLLTHELAHVVQQDRSGILGIVRRREVDDRSCANLTDIEPDVDNEVNHQIGQARTAATAASGSIDIQVLATKVFEQLGQGIISPIEHFVEDLPPAKRNRPPGNLAGTKYQGAPFASPLVSFGFVAASANVHGLCIGADKLGHFFDLGWRYWKASTQGATPDQIERLGRGSEMTIAGLGATGVYSNADLEANRAGSQFYKDLTSNPSGFIFAIKNYISDKWNEQANPSFYESGLGKTVWSNLLTGSWQGTRTTSAPASSANIQLDLTAAASGVSGTYEWPTGNAKPNKGKITAGQITQVTTTVKGDDFLATPLRRSPPTGKRRQDRV